MPVRLNLRRNSPRSTHKMRSIQDLGLAGFGLSVFLLILVGLNFYFDMRRRSGAPKGALARKFLVDLR